MNEQERGEQVVLAASGDAGALQRLIVHYHGSLHSAVDAAIDAELRHRIEADDVLQQAYTAAFRAVGDAEFAGSAQFYKWLEQIALNQLRDAQRFLRRRKRDVAREATARGPGGHNAAAGRGTAASYPDLVQRLAGRDSTPSRQLAKGEAVAAMMSCLARLKDDQREVVRLRFLEDVPVAEIAQRMGKTHTAVYTLCHRGLKSLRELMDSITRFLSRL